MTVENLVPGVIKHSYVSCTLTSRVCSTRNPTGPNTLNLWDPRTGVQHMISMQELSFASSSRAKVWHQRPLGAARAHIPKIVLLSLIWAMDPVANCFLREGTPLHHGAHDPELPHSMNSCYNLAPRFSLLPIKTNRRGPWEWGCSFHCTLANQFIF